MDMVKINIIKEKHLMLVKIIFHGGKVAGEINPVSIIMKNLIGKIIIINIKEIDLILEMMGKSIIIIIIKIIIIIIVVKKLKLIFQI